MMFSQGLLSELDRQQKYVYDLYKDGAPCPVCGKIQTPWAASDLSPKTWIEAKGPREHSCIECKTKLRVDVYMQGGWGWGNPAIRPHR